MTVKDYIEELKKLSQGMEVMKVDRDYGEVLEADSPCIKKIRKPIVGQGCYSWFLSEDVDDVYCQEEKTVVVL